MNFTYSFTARQINNKAITGLVMAESDAFAINSVKKMGFQSPRVTLDLWRTLESGFGLIQQGDFDLREKARFYETISKRIKLGGTFKEALDSATEYIEDGRLRSAVAIASAAQESGMRPWRSLELGGFSRRDVMVVKALDMVGGLDRSFWDLAQEAKLRNQTDNAVRSAMRMPKTMATMFYLSLPLFFGILGPQMLRFFKKLGAGVNIPPDIQALYGFVEEVSLNPMIWTSVWLACGCGGYMLLKSSLWQELKASIKSFHDLDLKSEHAQIWSVYALMYSANIAPQDICTILQPTCKLLATGESLYVMSRRLSAGADEISALEAAQFPRFVNAGYRSAKESGDLPDGLKSFCQMLQEDVQVLTERVQAALQKLSLGIGVMLILAVFYITYYPIAGPMLQSL